MRKVILICAKDSFSIVNFRFNLIKQIAKTGSELHVVCKPDEHLDVLLNIEGIKFYPLLASKRLPFLLINFINLLEVWFQIYFIKPTHVFSFTIFSNLPCGFYKRIFNPRARFYVNITGLGRFERSGKTSTWINRLLAVAFSKVDGIFVQNSRHAKRFRSINKNTVLLPGSGVELSKFEFMEPRNSGTINVLMSARILALKGVETYINTAFLAKSLHKKLHFSYCIGYGSQPNSLLFRKLEEAAKENAINLINFTQDVPSLLSSFDIIVLPTMYGEGIPKSLIEAQAMGIYVIASEISGNEDLVNKTGYGVLLSEVTPENILQEIDKFSQLNKKKRAAVAKEARKQIERHFDERLIIEKYLQCLY